jgi:smad nuclear-interacting protein 1
MTSIGSNNNEDGKRRRVRSRWSSHGDNNTDNSTKSDTTYPTASATNVTPAVVVVDGAAVVTDQDSVQALLAEAVNSRNIVAAQQRVDRTKQQQYNPSRKFQHSKEDSNDASKQNANKRPREDYYGPSTNQHDPIDRHSKSPAEDEEGKEEKKKPDFGLSGALVGSSSVHGGGGGTMYKGVVLKFQEPPEARTPNTLWRLYVFKDEKQIDTLHISKQSAYLIGRNEEIADIYLSHASISSQHAVLQYRALPNKDTGNLSCQPYLLDLESTNGSFINGVRIEAARYYQLKKGDVIKFGSSTREYVLLAAQETRN